MTVIQERHVMLDMEIGDGGIDTRSTYNVRYGDR